MSYVPGTKLSYGNDLDTATVLTDGAVMVTMLEGSHWREIMKLADWLILGMGKVTVVYSPSTSVPAPAVPVPVVPAPAVPAPAVPAVPVPVVPAPAVPAVPVPVVPAVPAPAVPVIVEAADYPYSSLVERTKFKWFLNKEHYCVAIQTRKGLLQVKYINQCACRDVSCGESYDKIYFNTYNDWIKSLPYEGAGGKVTITAP